MKVTATVTDATVIVVVIIIIIINFLLSAAFFGRVISSFHPIPAFAQKTYDEQIRFYPEVPTEKSDIVAIIYLTAPTPCHKVELQRFQLSGKSLSINVQIMQPPPDTVCVLVLKQHILKQSIGMLDAGVYDVRLYTNGEQRAATRLYVSENDIAILATGKYVDEQGDIHLVGEVQNNVAADHPVKRVRADVAFFEGDRLVGEQQVYTTIAMIMPNRTSGFDLVLDKDMYDKDYSVRVTSFSVEQKTVEKGLVLFVDPKLDEEEGFGIISGRVFNVAARDATQVKIACVIYDSSSNINRNVIDSVFGYTEPSTIPAGQEAEFEISTHNKVSQQFTASCNAESAELAIEKVQVIPEFPAASVTATTAISLATAAAAVLVSSNRLRNKL